jgi:hypothetical protein
MGVSGEIGCRTIFITVRNLSMESSNVRKLFQRELACRNLGHIGIDVRFG